MADASLSESIRAAATLVAMTHSSRSLFGIGRCYSVKSENDRD